MIRVEACLIVLQRNQPMSLSTSKLQVAENAFLPLGLFRFIRLGTSLQGDKLKPLPHVPGRWAVFWYFCPAFLHSFPNRIIVQLAVDGNIRLKIVFQFLVPNHRIPVWACISRAHSVRNLPIYRELCRKRWLPGNDLLDMISDV